MPVLIPDDAPSRARPKAEPFDWDTWLVPGQRIEFHRSLDFPDSDMEMFRQALRNAAGRRGLKGKYETHKIDDDTFELTWKDNEQLPAED